MLDNLSEEQEKLVEDISNEWIDDVHSGNTFIDQIKASRAITNIYAIAEMEPPCVIFLDGPMDAINFCRNELKQNVNTIDWFGMGYDSGWVSFYDYFQRIGILERDEDGFNSVKEFLKSGVWATILFDTLAICISRPNTVKIDSRGELHCENGPAIAFDDGYSEFSWHGTWVSEQIIMYPETLTKEQILEEKNSEVSRAIAERLGWDKYLKFIDTVLIDKWFDERTSCHYELYDFKERKGSLQPRLLKMESPECNDGTRPYYIEPVPPEMKTCKAARRWQCDTTGEEYKDKPAKWVAECNENQELIFDVEA